MKLVLGNGVAGRRVGLPRHIGGSLLRSINASESQHGAPMPRAISQRATADVKAESLAKRAEDEEEDINRPPDSDSENDSDEAFRQASNEDITSTDFVTEAKRREEQKANDIIPARRGKKTTSIGNGDPTTKTRSRRGKISPASTQSNGSPEQKVQEERKLGVGMTDGMGFVKVVKKRKTNTAQSYGKNATRPANKIESADEKSPQKSFKKRLITESPEQSEVEEKSTKKMFKKVPTIGNEDESDTEQKSPERTFKKRSICQSPEKSDVEQDSSFRRPNYPADDSPATTPKRKFKTTAVAQSPGSEGMVQQPAIGDSDATIDELLGRAGTLLSKESIPKPPAPALVSIDYDEEDFQTMTQMAKCPMCGETVNPADLRAFGRMDTRKQEKFCRSHRKATALDTWKAEEYPTINWAKLDARITKHHSFIKGLINGADSYYRDRLAETVNAGKDRLLLKSNYNPVPGYYGTRGLRAISENTMRKFTPLLKRRMVVDRLMAARGFTPYVEYVVVPEVAIKLIMEDMKCEEERAREIMSESLEVGELLSEEIKDVVTRRGSDEMEDSDV